MTWKLLHSNFPIDAYREDIMLNVQTMLTPASGARAAEADKVPKYRGSLLNP